MLELPKSKVAAVQTAPVFLDPAATVDKACALIAEAAGNGAKLVAFPEVFVAGYPYWNWLMTPVEGSEWFERLCRAAITVPGPEVEQLCAAARAHDCTVVIGVNERDPRALGTLYNTNLVIGADGTLLGRHRKLVPTWAEKLTWAGGDGASLRVYDTPVGPLGTLACGENTNTLARFALLSAGELVHVANYISLPVAPASYNMADAIRIRATAHSFEGKLFTIVACSTVSEEIIAAMSAGRPANRALLERRQSAFSGVIGPDGNLVGDPLIDDEGIVYAEIDLSRCIQPKQMHDIIGAYNRFDIFDLRIDRRPRTSASWRDDEVPPADDGGAEPPTA
ncbi:MULTISPECIES: carbon-nitrogen hydrolase family protein [unclassified Sphingopyxis]|uniref:carbon-nitrogen hydrolase family protein n=1 Tax=unclassified Sphingopyxis TaxID=2614943 RepID=UPI000730D304|nr:MULTISPECIES: carbon-nitrogen hydrolase family protein [unclassified Sphingopyxis]KTE28005.1 aliphatic nitrilase [Sphingopyxis sp. H057]KTE55616.1 aliphatic nitrilase [Sphingopyxis sp. H073]KTE57502.1 aliphatic nitrilase [Sphingopyxis sp. H071]KTE61589.1 aliphatic nitrilase [Sphingopyxis sp. H107]KTE66503.1 aliphatic nitrilase [Sphingopyxis sp. H100]